MRRVGPRRGTVSPAAATLARPRGARSVDERAADADRLRRVKANRSVPTSAVIPEVPYPDVRAAASWLAGAFGFRERLRIGGHRVQMTFGDGALVVVEGGSDSPRCRTLVRVPSADAHHERARAFGARIARAPETFPYGERQYAAEDLEGHSWTFSESVADVAPADWGGELVGDEPSATRLDTGVPVFTLPEVVKTPEARRAGPRTSDPRDEPSPFCHIVVPAPDLERARGFYESVFAWRVKAGVPGETYWFFESGNVGGALDRRARPSPGSVVLVLRVADIDACLARVAEHGGTVLRAKSRIGEASSGFDAYFRDPNGNDLGVFAES